MNMIRIMVGRPRHTYRSYDMERMTVTQIGAMWMIEVDL